MKHVHFTPWVGKNYTTGINGKRLMVLGESHYCANPETEDRPELTCYVMEDLFNPTSPHEEYKNTYTKFERALSGKAVNVSDKTGKREAWESVLFYNYVQTPMNAPRTPPSKKQFEDSEKAFFEVLETYRPHKVVAWGSRLYNNLPKGGLQQADLTLADGSSIEVWSYTLADGQVVEVLPCTHPSAGFSWEHWHTVIQEFLKRQ